jgi:anti-sigma-K factor RskA
MTRDLHSLAAAYALDALDPDERAEFEAHLAVCERCIADVAEFGETAATLAESSGIAPPAHLKATVMSRLESIDQVVPSQAATPPTKTADPMPVADLAIRRRRRFSLPSLLAAAAVVVLVVVGAVVISADRGGSEFDDVAASADAVVTRLDGTGGSFRVAYSAQRDRVALRGEDVDDLEPGLRYALWAIADGTPVPAGLFASEEGSIEGAVELADVSADAWGITVEPETGSDVPTLPIIAIGEV